MQFPIESCGLCGLANVERRLPVFRNTSKTIFVLPNNFNTSHVEIISGYGDIIFESFCMNGYIEVCSTYFNMIIQCHRYTNLVASTRYLKKVFMGRQFDEYVVENIYGIKVIPVEENYLDMRVKEEIR